MDERDFSGGVRADGGSADSGNKVGGCAAKLAAFRGGGGALLLLVGFDAARHENRLRGGRVSGAPAGRPSGHCVARPGAEQWCGYCT
ncbi:hypothetical protein RirG_031970 [Rhizophagus irregularis DAOM 197198w]|uniref:Uncharacterized protein n=1 Tax=Rhizophagus irregularis (strain DAOM 197198w) TaxID=1432141 RepID=A0A015LV53_RHIIW|nr:hypothetical protein RirG_031970 [Rhizophagus irregularis DAOM 197198w]